MKQIADIKEIHSILLEIAKEFHRICVKHSIPYYMLGGTMLGAIRHKGFIPWDDDMDFGVPRKYIKRLLEVLRNDLPSHLSLITSFDDYGVANEIIKITDKRTIVDETGKENILNKMGLFIDVFPLDITNNDWSTFSRNHLYSVLLSVNNLRYYPSSRPIKKVIGFVIKCIPVRLFLRLIRLMLTQTGNYITNYSGAWGSKETVFKDVFGNPLLYSFEDCYFFGVEDNHNYLKSLYGNYMQLPPEQKRHTHLINVYWI